ncbi:MAG: hypothetical protein DMD79_12970 [Candidatus Rokuibacteriota bacterium]|nr:MAG: hypothetical protein DMD79_12970 [Candidatus Rokubacteria bacterium]
MDTAVADRVLARVDRDALVDLASRGYQVELQEVEPDRLQAIATLPGAGGGPRLMFNGHTDINSLARGWTRDPFTPWVEGDRLYGHGVQNMKGGLATMIQAAEAIRQAGVRLRGDLVLACVVGETQGGEGTHHLLERGHRTDMAVLTEPYGLGHLVTLHGGILHLAIHTYGVTGHISQIEKTVSAVLKMTDVVQALQQVRFTFRPHAELPALPRLNVGSIIGGRGERYVLVEPPYVPDLCTIIVDVHFLPGQTVEGIVLDLRRRLDALRDADPTLRYEIEIPPPAFFKGRRRLVMEPVDVPRDSPIVQAVARHHQAVTGRPPAVIGALLPMSYSAGDSSWLWKAGIPCLHYGPAGGFLETGPGGSYILISEMEACAKVLALTALDVCGIAA